MSENNDGGFAERGNTVGSAGGLAQAGGPNTSSGGTGTSSGTSGGGTVSDKSAGTSNPTNYGSIYGGTVYSNAYPTSAYGITPFNVPRKDQTLQDRMYGSLGSGMVGTSFGGSNGTGANQSNPVVQQSMVWSPTLKKYVPKPTPKPYRNPITGKMVYPQATPIRPQNYGFVNPQTGYHTPAPGDPAWNPNWQNIVDPTLPVRYPSPGIYSPGYTGGLAGTPGVSPVESGNWLGPSVGGNFGDLGGIFGDNGQSFNDPRGGSISGGPPNQAGRQFGGPVEPGQQYTVGENGPETLQMGPGGGGQVIPHNPMDRLGGMRPEMMQQFHQLLQQMRHPRPQGQPGAMQPPRPQMPGQPSTYPPAPPQGIAVGEPNPGMPPPRQVGPPQMGIAGLSRPQPQNMGFGGSGLGQPGILGRMRGAMG